MYVSGFIHGYEARGSGLCLPGNLTVGEAVAVFVRQWRSVEAQKGGVKHGAARASSSRVCVHGSYDERLPV